MQAKLEIGPRGAGVTWNVGPDIILFPAVSSCSAGRTGQIWHLEPDAHAMRVTGCRINREPFAELRLGGAGSCRSRNPCMLRARSRVYLFSAGGTQLIHDVERHQLL